MKINVKNSLFFIFILLAAAFAYYCYTAYQPTQKPLLLYGNVDIRSVDASFRVGGRLASVDKEEGDSVKQGDVIATLDQTPYQIAIEKAKASLAAQQAQLDLLTAGYPPEEVEQARAQVEQQRAAYDYAQNTYERQLALSKTGAASKDELDNAQSQRNQTKAALKNAEDKLKQFLKGYRIEDIDTAKANIDLVKSDIKQSELNLADTTLIAPSDGVILTRIVEAGTMLPQGSPVYSISLTDPIWIRAYIDEVNLGQAQPGRAVLIYTDANPDTPYTGKIGFVSPTAEFTPKTVETSVLRTDLVYRLRVIVNEGDEMLRQGMPVTIQFKE